METESVLRMPEITNADDLKKEIKQFELQQRQSDAVQEQNARMLVKLAITYLGVQKASVKRWALVKVLFSSDYDFPQVTTDELEMYAPQSIRARYAKMPFFLVGEARRAYELLQEHNYIPFIIPMGYYYCLFAAIDDQLMYTGESRSLSVEDDLCGTTR